MKMELSTGTVVFGIIGIVCIIYSVALATTGGGSRFFLVWGAGGIGAVLFGILLAPNIAMRYPDWIRVCLCIIVGVGMVVLFSVIGVILTRSTVTASQGADYCIILGAQLKKTGPSNVLRRRLDKALEYLEENPETMVVVTGGKGKNEKKAEAEGMKEYLLDAGISEERILVENKSRNTTQNLDFSSAFLDKNTSKVVIVTSNFHMFRALKIAEKQGYQAEGLAATSLIWMLPNNLVREVLALAKELMVGNI